MFIWGLLIAIVVTGILLFVLINVADGEVTPVAWIVALAMCGFLSWETTKILNEFDENTNLERIVSVVETTAALALPADWQEYTFNTKEANIIAAALKAVRPRAKNYVHASDFEGKTWTSVTETIAKVVRRSKMSTIAAKIGWCVLAMLVGSGLIVLVGMKKKKKRTTSSYSSYSSSSSYDDF